MPKYSGMMWMLAFVAVFLIATYAVSQLTSLAPRVMHGSASAADLLIGVGYLAVTLVSVLILGRMIYSSERAAGRVRRRVKMFE